MPNSFFHSIRPYVGGLAAALGCFGLFLFAITLPMSHFAARFAVGLSYLEGPQPSPEQLTHAIHRSYLHIIHFRLTPLFLISLLLLSYSFYEAYREASNNQL